MSHVTLTHPDLPDQPIHVEERSVPHHERAGWVAPLKSPEPEPDAPAETKPAAPSRRRRTTAKES